MADIGAVFKKVLPFLSAAAPLGGPIAVMASNAINAALGGKSVQPTSESITQALTLAGANADQLAAMQKAEQDFKLQMQQLGFQDAEQLEKIAADDRASARQREMTIRDHVPALLALVITLGFFGMLAGMFKWTPPASNEKLLDIMLGSLGTAWIAVVTYYFGSSAGSEKKNEIIAAVTGAIS